MSNNDKKAYGPHAKVLTAEEREAALRDHYQGVPNWRTTRNEMSTRGLSPTGRLSREEPEMQIMPTQEKSDGFKSAQKESIKCLEVRCVDYDPGTDVCAVEFELEDTRLAMRMGDSAILTRGTVHMDIHMDNQLHMFKTDGTRTSRLSTDTPNQANTPKSEPIRCFYFCEACGSPDVRALSWCGINDSVNYGDADDRFHCPSCEDDCTIISFDLTAAQFDERACRARAWSEAFSGIKERLTEIEEAQTTRANKKREELYIDTYGITGAGSAHWRVFWALLTKTSGKGWLLVHGNRVDGKGYCGPSAWLEHIGRGRYEVTAAGNLMRCVPTRIEATISYPKQKAIDLMRKHKHAGPWGEA